MSRGNGALTKIQVLGHELRYRSTKQEATVRVGSKWRQRYGEAAGAIVRVEQVSDGEVRGKVVEGGGLKKNRSMTPHSFIHGFELVEDAPKGTPIYLQDHGSVLRADRDATTLAIPGPRPPEMAALDLATAFENLRNACRDMADAANQFRDSALATACLVDEGHSPAEVKKALADVARAAVEKMGGREQFRAAMTAIRAAAQ